MAAMVTVMVTATVTEMETGMPSDEQVVSDCMVVEVEDSR